MDDNNLSVYMFNHYGVLPIEIKLWALLIGVLCFLVGFILEQREDK